jgi:hypothetical protein
MEKLIELCKKQGEKFTVTNCQYRPQLAVMTSCGGHDPIWRIGRSGKNNEKACRFYTCNELGSVLLIHRKILRQDLMIISDDIYIKFV